jgi:uncharacterized protein YbjT (DUF2867 family)
MTKPESGGVPGTVLVTNGTGKTGRRVADRLHRLGVPVRQVLGRPPREFASYARTAAAAAGAWTVEGPR